MRLARSREQHELALALHLLRLRFNNSINDLADHLGADRANLGRKLNGTLPATEWDLILWAWVTDEPRRSIRPNDLTEEPIAVPRFPMNRRRER